MNKLWIYLIFAAPLLSVSAMAEAPSQTATCMACHGPKGISVNPLWPNLAGQKAQYLKKQLHDFKSDKRQEPLMNGIAKSLSEKDIETLAEYYSSLK